MRRLLRLLSVVAVLGLAAAACGNGDDTALSQLNVAYFRQWPTANQHAQLNGIYDAELGLTVNWIPLDDGADMTEAMKAGDVDISYSQGLTPFAKAVTGGGDLLIVGVAVSYADADNCVAGADYAITRRNAAETLAGQSIYTPLGTVTHFKLLKMLDHLGVDTAGVDFIESEGSAAAVAALASGEVAMACAFGGAVNEMLANGGNLVMTGAEQEAIGIRVFDIISVTSAFADEHPDVVTAFLQVTTDANRAYSTDREPLLDDIASAAGMNREDTIRLLDAFGFPSKATQLSADWLGGTVGRVMKQQMDFFVEQGEIDAALADYDAFVVTRFLEAVE